MAPVHPDAYLQLITGDLCPGKSGPLFLYSFAGAVIVCREAPHYDLHQVVNEQGQEIARLMAPGAEIEPDKTLRVPRPVFEAWLLEEGPPLGVIRHTLYSRAQMAALWGRVLPMGSGPATLRFAWHGQTGAVLGLEDRLDQAVACCPSYPHGDLTSQVPDLEALMRKILGS